jgi:hypothetical protein
LAGAGGGAEKSCEEIVMKEKNEQMGRKVDVPVEAFVKVKRHANRNIRRDVFSANFYGVGFAGIFERRPPMWHPAPNLF